MKRLLRSSLLAAVLATLLASCAVMRAAGPPEVRVEQMALPAGGARNLSMDSGAIPSAPEAELKNYGVEGGGDSAAIAERLVIRNADLTMVVADPAESVQEISRLAEELGGFVVSSNVSQTIFGEAAVVADQGSIMVRVPADRFEEALTRIKEGATEVRSENRTGEDVTQQYTDLESRLRNLEAAEQELREIMASAVRTEDVLSVYNQLVQIRGEIELVKGQMQYFEQSARFSAISVSLLPDVAEQPLQIGGWQPAGTAKEALEALIRTLQFLADAGIWLVICVLPIGLIFGVPGWFVGRAIWRRRRAARAAKEAGAAAEKKA